MLTGTAVCDQVLMFYQALVRIKPSYRQTRAPGALKMKKTSKETAQQSAVNSTERLGVMSYGWSSSCTEESRSKCLVVLVREPAWAETLTSWAGSTAWLRLHTQSLRLEHPLQRHLGLYMHLSLHLISTCFPLSMSYTTQFKD